MTSEKQKRSPQLPPVFNDTPESIIHGAERLIEQSRQIQDGLAANIQPEIATFANTLLPLALDENTRGTESFVLEFYQNVSADEKLRTASSKAQGLLDDFRIQTATREDLFTLINAAFDRKEDLDPESQLLLEKTREDYIRNGLGLPTEKRQRFKDIKMRLNQLKIDFVKNVNEENGGIWFTREQLNGVPADLLSELETGQGENEGKLRLTFKNPDFFPAMRYVKNTDTRRQIYVGHQNRCNQNVPLLKETIVLRDEAARLLGWPNHAAFRLDAKMAKTPAKVDSFLAELRSRFTPGGLEEMGNLKEVKKADLDSRGEHFDGRWYAWDSLFYKRIMVDKEYSVDPQKISEYFPLSNAIQRMLQIFETLFGLVFQEITGEERDNISETGKGADVVWHEDVRLFAVWEDEGTEFVGYLYMDLHPRDGKFGHAANFTLQPGFIDANGQRRYPATALVCNFSKPMTKKPSLLKHDEVTMLFHELGHGIHDLVGRTIYARFHGTMTVQDFCETPSIMLENWCWTPGPLKFLSRHYSTLSPEYFELWKQEQSDADGEIKSLEEELPDELVNSLIKTKNANQALFYLGQIQVAMFDMAIHEPESHEKAEEMNTSEIFNSLKRTVVWTEGPPGEGDNWGHGEATFSHFLGDYDAGYYGYFTAGVYALDMFYTFFKSDPMNAEQGRRYRRMVLEKGGGQDEMKTLVDYLGREPNMEAFNKEWGLV